MAQFITLQCIARQCIARLCIRYCARSMRSTTFLPSFLAPAKEYRLSGCETTLALRLGSTRPLMAAAQAPESPLAVEEALSARDHLHPACRARRPVPALGVAACTPAIRCALAAVLR